MCLKNGLKLSPQICPIPVGSERGASLLKEGLRALPPSRDHCQQCWDGQKQTGFQYKGSSHSLIDNEQVFNIFQCWDLQVLQYFTFALNISLYEVIWLQHLAKVWQEDFWSEISLILVGDRKWAASLFEVFQRTWKTNTFRKVRNTKKLEDKYISKS